MTGSVSALLTRFLDVMDDDALVQRLGEFHEILVVEKADRDGEMAKVTAKAKAS